MSQSEQVKFKCGSCGESVDVTVWHTVDVAINPELKDQVLDTDLMSFVCPQCGYVTEAQSEMLFQDLAHAYMIWLQFPDDQGKLTFARNALDVPKDTPNIFRLRIVSDANGLAEKIRVFDDGLDDRAVELMKQALWQQGMCDTTMPKESLHYSHTWTQEGRQEVVFVQFDINGPLKSFHVAWDEGYGKMLDTLRNKYRVPENDNRWLIVDNEYPLELAGGKPKVDRIVRFR